ncbi:MULTISPECIES: immune inhibitor A domain-containing protein [Streptomyces]|uniref:Secreted protease n=3 Tax=Streptomyces TaxID=1883 RepID=B1VVT7_STRGG|nr:immune inhibitor A domain-containing protein [Streptomyces griseus]MYR15880.1 M6 family metalloprotease domain-containing protein [Streptomyces sp. SID724]MBW3707104.1 M6 family metalloprotease domain-containing protein [Streptomyces griseus]NEB54174.1 M6 family metalloprotease domain-containing protein [Streptomyces griseus]SEE66292.1 immune inhibitor A [Streptomyces griseus]SQA22940.1 M6 family metalloprotease domain protein Precursor [Streptomyces griseus]
MTNQRRALRAAAVVVAMAATAATASTFATAQAHDSSSGSGVSTVDRRDPAPAKGHVEHNLEGPFSEQQAAQREAALEQVLSGDKKVANRGGSKVVKLGDKKYVELGREKTDKIFTILLEFGDQVDDTTMFDPDGDGPKPPVKKYGGAPGPAHNKIAKPDPKKDNSTAWKADYNQEHFQELYFGEGKGVNSLKTYYEKTSSGRYSVEGEVSDWVKVPYNEARYGSNYCGQSNCANVWDAVRDGVNAWVADQKAKGRTDAEIKANLAEYDEWDRYDFDGDGNFNEPDGYIDHFQLVHAGEDESAGGGAEGTNAIWAHRWYAYGTNAGATGPANNKAGGAQIGDTGIWVGDYTVQPENGGLGVFAHEYAHDLGLPDLYDTSGGGENSVGFWSLMSAGSWLGTGEGEIGNLPGDMTSWDKLQLGWLDYDKAKAGKTSLHKLGVSEYNTENPQALVVELPKKAVTTTVVKPAEGAKQWWSDMGDDLSNTLTRSVDLTGKSKATLDLSGWYDIEADYDYLYTEVSDNGGANWTALDGTADGKALPRDASDKPALTGVSGAYQKLSFSLDAYAGKKVDLRFRYQTDGGAGGKGFAADAITVTADGAAIFSDNAEGDDNGWTAKGFSRIGESFTQDYPQYYIAENRQYVSYDETLKVGPYNFGFSGTRPDWVEHYAYENGLLLWLWDTSQKDNNTSVHPGQGLILPIDAHAKPLKWKDGSLLRNKIQPFDATFSWYPNKGFTLHNADVPQYIKPALGNPVFDDRKGTYWYKENPTGSVKVSDTNTRISIVHEPRNGSTMSVLVSPSGR